MVFPPIAFHCPHCGILLTVPAEQAGVQGPCPRCAYAIRAPIPGSHAGFPPPYPTMTPPGAVPRTSPPPQAPSPSTQAAPEPAERQATYASVPIAPRNIPPSAAPRDNGPAHKEKLEPSGQPEISPQPEEEYEPSPVFKKLLLRLMMPLPFLAAILLVVFGLMKVLKRQDAATSRPTHTATETGHPSPNQENPPSSQTPTQTTPDTQPTSRNSSASSTPLTHLRPSAASEAIALLEKFLHASSLEERLPIIETKADNDALQSSVLASPLPPFRNLIIESQKSFPLENIVDMYFSFEFINKDLSSNPHIMVVRHRGSLPPRVLADPFLDLYGGRLAAFASKPQTKGQLFHVIVTPFPTCNDLKIPDREKKITLRLLPHENSDKVIHAYVSRVSKIGETISSGHYDLVYGKPQACVILLGWNTKESPGAPYLEALDIRAFHWNP